MPEEYVQRNCCEGPTWKIASNKYTIFSDVCVDIIGPISPPSDGHRYILTTVDMCTRFPETSVQAQ